MFTQAGRLIEKVKTEADNFNSPLMLSTGYLLPGAYYVQIKPVWNETADYHPNYKKVRTDLYCSEAGILLEPVSA